MRTLKIFASKKYDITVTSGLENFSDAVMPLFAGKKVALISDDNVFDRFGEKVKKKLVGKEVHSYVIKAGEKSKDAKNYIRLLNCLASDGFTRKDAVITLGGGVVGDLGAFVASTYMRGIALVAMPTSLLAAVDSSVGGKTAINLEKGKNLCGTFYQPSAVYVNLDFLEGLPQREINSGLGEVIKYTFLDKNLSYNGQITEDLIYDCLKIKANIVEKDEFEGGQRKLLNFGHTVGHAIEKLSDFSLSHGECVLKGIGAALEISRLHYGLSDETFSGYLDKLKRAETDLSYGYSPSEIAKVIENDKKGNGESVDCVLINKNGDPEIVNLKTEKIKGYLEKCRLR